MDDLAELVSRALAEDVGAGDLTSEAVIPTDVQARARVIQKEEGIVFGLTAAAETFSQAGAAVFEPQVAEAEWRGRVPAEVGLASGPARALLAAERTALNFLCHLSGIATLTARFADAVRGTGVAILDTRKTTPGLRALEKAAVAAGGGQNHRLGLDDAILIKENHLAIVGSIRRAVELAGEAHPGLEIEVECRTIGEVGEALAAGAGRLLLDNMDPEAVRAAVAARGEARSSAKLEASGGVTLANVAELATTGVETISIGTLTHSAPALDLSMLLEPL